MENVCMGLIKREMLEHIMCCMALHTNPFFRLVVLLSTKRETLNTNCIFIASPKQRLLTFVTRCFRHHTPYDEPLGNNIHHSVTQASLLPSATGVCTKVTVSSGSVYSRC